MFAAVVVIAAAAGIWVLREAASVLKPLALAALLFYFAFPLVRGLVRRKVPKWAAIAAVFLLLAAMMGGLGLLVRAGVNDFIEQYPTYKEKLQELSRQVNGRIGSPPIDAEEAKKTIRDNLAAAVGGVAVLGGYVLLVLAYLLFMLISGRSRWEAVVPETSERKARRILEEIEEEMPRYLWLRTAIAVGQGVAVYVLLKAYGVPSAALWTVFNALGQFVPYIGPIVTTLPPVLAALVESPATALQVLAWLTLLQVLIGYFIEGPVMGKGMELDVLMVLFGLMLFGWLWGGVGAFLAVPILSVLRIVCRRVEGLGSLGELLEQAPRKK